MLVEKQLASGESVSNCRNVFWLLCFSGISKTFRYILQHFRLNKKLENYLSICQSVISKTVNKVSTAHCYLFLIVFNLSSAIILEHKTFKTARKHLNSLVFSVKATWFVSSYKNIFDSILLDHLPEHDIKLIKLNTYTWLCHWTFVF